MSRINLGVKPYTTPQPVWILVKSSCNNERS